MWSRVQYLLKQEKEDNILREISWKVYNKEESLFLVSLVLGFKYLRFDFNKPTTWLTITKGMWSSNVDLPRWDSRISPQCSFIVHYFYLNLLILYKKSISSSYLGSVKWPLPYSIHYIKIDFWVLGWKYGEITCLSLVGKSLKCPKTFSDKVPPS